MQEVGQGREKSKLLSAQLAAWDTWIVQIATIGEVTDEQTRLDLVCSFDTKHTHTVHTVSPNMSNSSIIGPKAGNSPTDGQNVEFVVADVQFPDPLILIPPTSLPK